MSMKIKACCLLLLLLPAVCYAAPIYGPDMPKRGQWYIGFETNLVFERDMHKGLGEAESNQYFYNTSYGVYDWLSFDGKLGVGDTEFDTVETGHLDFDSGFAGAYGLRFRIYNDESKKVKAIFGFQHISAHPPHETVNDVKYTAIWDEWQFSLLISKAYGRFEPYLGLKASQLYLIRKDNVEKSWSWNGSEDHFGVVLGSHIDLSENLYINVDGRFIDENAFSTALTYKL